MPVYDYLVYFHNYVNKLFALRNDQQAFANSLLAVNPTLSSEDVMNALKVSIFYILVISVWKQFKN
jgi:hypothetical protein